MDSLNSSGLNKSDDEKLKDQLNAHMTDISTRKRKFSDTDNPYTTLLIDIEGTVAPISFVKDVMFPYVRENIEQFLQENFSTVECQNCIQELSELAKEDDRKGLKSPQIDISEVRENKDSNIQQIIENIFWQMDEDRKTTALKKLQGFIWKDAFENGKIRSEIYPDVLPVLKEWYSKDIHMYIYSSGSIAAQKLFFGYSISGNLLKFFKGHFDTTIGSKLESESYRNILKEINQAAEDVLFLTDNINEARAAKEVDIKTILLVRPGNEPLTDEDKLEFKFVSTFAEIVTNKGEVISKR